MSQTFSINNSKDIICDSLFLLDTNNTLQNVLDLISAGGGGGGGSGITTLTGSGAAIITGTATSKNITVDLSMFSTTTQMTTLLNNKQNILTAGTNITISNNTISSSQAQLTVQLDGVNQACSTLNFVQNNALLSGGVLNVSRLTHYDKIPLIYSTQATIKDITQDVNSNLLWGTEIVTTNPYLSVVLQAYSTTANLANNLSNYTTTTLMNNLLNGKADDAAVTSGFASVNVELSQKLESSLCLTAVPANMPFSTLVTELSKISNMVDGVSGISLGTGTGSSQRIACFETAGNGNYFYGIGLVEQTGSLPGMGIWASTGANVPHQNSSSSSGVNPHLMVSNIGNVGIGVVAPTQRLHVVGNILCSGTISGSSKSFDIEHPDPDKAEQKYRLRHWCVESDVAGGMVMYRKQITTTKASTVFIEMPNWFEHLVKNVIVFCSPDEHFGNAWGKYINNNIIEIHTSKGGKYNILITCDRADVCATTMCPQEVEFIPAEPILDGGGMP